MRRRKTLLEDGRDAGPASIHGRARRSGRAAVGVDDLADPHEPWSGHPGTEEGAQAWGATVQRRTCKRVRGRSMTPTGSSLTAQPVKVLNILDDCSRMAMACRAITELHWSHSVGHALAAPPRSTAGRNDFCRTTLRRSATCLPKRSPLSVSPPCTPAPTTLAATARSNGSIKPRNAGCARRPTATTHHRVPDPAQRVPSSSTTTNAHTAPIDRRFPADVWAATPKSGPANQPDQPSHDDPPRHRQRRQRLCWQPLQDHRRTPLRTANQPSSSPPTPTATSSSMADSPADSPSTPPNASNPSTPPTNPPPRGKTRDMRGDPTVPETPIG